MTFASPQSSSDAAALRNAVNTLIDACHNAERAFAIAAGSGIEPILRAELIQYSRQWSEFEADVLEAIASTHPAWDERPGFPGQLTDNRSTVAIEDDRFEGLEAAAIAGEVAAVLGACEQENHAALEAYRDALQAAVPYALASVVNSQFLAIWRVHDRLQSLADRARGTSPIDNRH